MKNMKVIKHQIYTGKWRKIKWRENLVGCCDCRLVHSHDYKVIGNDLYERVFRKDKLTKKARENL
jgi:hypothetical protein